MVLPDVNDYKEMDCAGASAFSRRDTNLKVSKARKQHGLVGKKKPINRRVAPERPWKPKINSGWRVGTAIPGPEETYQDMIFKLGYRQEERHGTLTATFAGSNPANPTKAQFYLSSTWMNGLMERHLAAGKDQCLLYPQIAYMVMHPPSKWGKVVRFYQWGRVARSKSTGSQTRLINWKSKCQASGWP